MIGGTDIVFHGPTTSEDVDLILRTLLVKWPDARIQAADSLDATSLRDFRLLAPVPVELIVYRDAASLDSWRASGATSENQGAMMHLIANADGTTIVVDRADSPLAWLARDILQPLSRP